jgi:hypothetical protein
MPGKPQSVEAWKKHIEIACGFAEGETVSIIHGRQRGVLLNFQIKKPTATSPNIMLIIFGSIKIPCR